HAPSRQLFQAPSQFAVPLRFPRSIAMRRSSQSHQPAGVPLAHLVLDFDVPHDCPKSRRRYQFFESTSFSARLSSVSSATTCFLVFQLLQPFRLPALHPTVLRLPPVVSLLADPMLSA